MKTDQQIKDFMDTKTYCYICNDFKKELKKIYETEGLESANVYISHYDGFLCKTLQLFLHFS